MTRTPVVFVPGFSGSFNLPVLLDLRGPTLNGWDFPPFIDYGKTFLEGFRRAGYTRNRDLFVAFYDWRKSVKDTAREYLVHWIDRALKRSGSTKVILIAHSMGGLVARSYIQSSSYRHDVERLITLGTPHRGSPEAYFPWGGGELRYDPSVRAVFDVYLWFLQHFHPFETELNRLQTIRTQVLAIRDLLPIDGYLVDENLQVKTKSISQMYARNTWVELLNNPSNIATLYARVPVTTFSGAGISTLQSITVTAPPQPPSTPPLFPDGRPTDTKQDSNGDGTVPLHSAQLTDSRVRNLPATPIRHDKLADSYVAQVLTELGQPVPELPPEPANLPRLVIMSASPVDLLVELPTPALPPDVLGAGAKAPRQARPRRQRGRNYGHAGKHLNIVVIPQPPTGVYNVQVQGSATGTFALGAVLIGGDQEAVLLGGSGAEAKTPSPTPTAIATTYGTVAAGTTLHYQVSITNWQETPQVQLDRDATANDALQRIKQAVQTPIPGVLGGSSDAVPQVRATLASSTAPAPARERVEAALTSDDAAATADVTAMLGSKQELPQINAVLQQITSEVVVQVDPDLAEALAVQLQQMGGS